MIHEISNQLAAKIQKKKKQKNKKTKTNARIYSLKYTI